MSEEAPRPSARALRSGHTLCDTCPFSVLLKGKFVQTSCSFFPDVTGIELAVREIQRLDMRVYPYNLAKDKTQFPNNIIFLNDVYFKSGNNDVELPFDLYDFDYIRDYLSAGDKDVDVDLSNYLLTPTAYNGHDVNTIFWCKKAWSDLKPLRNLPKPITFKELLASIMEQAADSDGDNNNEQIPNGATSPDPADGNDCDSDGNQTVIVPKSTRVTRSEKRKSESPSKSVSQSPQKSPKRRKNDNDTVKFTRLRSLNEQTPEDTGGGRTVRHGQIDCFVETPPPVPLDNRGRIMGRRQKKQNYLDEVQVDEDGWINPQQRALDPSPEKSPRKKVPPLVPKSPAKAKNTKPLKKGYFGGRPKGYQSSSDSDVEAVAVAVYPKTPRVAAVTVISDRERAGPSWASNNSKRTVPNGKSPTSRSLANEKSPYFRPTSARLTSTSIRPGTRGSASSVSVFHNDTDIRLISSGSEAESINISSISTSSNSSGHRANRASTPTKNRPRSNSRSTPPRCPKTPPRRGYTREDGQNLVDFIIKQKGWAGKYHRGNKMWEYIQKKRLLAKFPGLRGRTYQSLKEHFRKAILPDLLRKRGPIKYRISTEDLNTFLADYKTSERNKWRGAVFPFDC